jgi:hypothetical protein
MHMKLSFQDEEVLRLSWRSLDRVVETASIDFSTINEIITSPSAVSFPSHTLPPSEDGTWRIPLLVSQGRPKLTHFIIVQSLMICSSR